MKAAYYFSYVMAAFFILGETVRRGFEYFSINATTMIEDYSCGILLLWAALSWRGKQAMSSKLMVAAWGYAAGGMLVPFAAHLEAWLRGATFRPDHPHEDIGAIVLKGVIWAVCLTFLVVTLRSSDRREASA
jgi:hypothetical protein